MADARGKSPFRLSLAGIPSSELPRANPDATALVVQGALRVGAFKRFARLRHLSLSASGKDGPRLTELGLAPELVTLWLTSGGRSNQALGNLLRDGIALPALKRLAVTTTTKQLDTLVRRSDLSALSALTSLATSGPLVGPEASLRDLPRLQCVSLGMTDARTEATAGLSELRVLDLRTKSGVDRAGAAALANAHPKLEVLGLIMRSRREARAWSSASQKGLKVRSIEARRFLKGL